MKPDIGIKETDRKEIAEGLSHLLADTYSLYLKTHYYHWNVEGPQFQTLHLMFETHYTEMAIAVDDIAERIRILGHKAPGTYKAFSKLSSVKEDDDLPSAREMIQNLLTAHETVIRTAKSILPKLDGANDEATQSLLGDRIVIHEKTAWMLRSLLVD